MPEPSPAQRAQARAAVLVATTVLVDRALKTVDDVVLELEGLQYDTLTAERLVLLVPLAFGRVALKAKGVEHYAWTARIDTEDGGVMQLDLQRDPIFLEALRYGVESFEGEGVDDEGFERVSNNSPEVGAALHAEARGEDVRQARVHEVVWRSRLSSDDWAAVARVAPSR